MKPASASRGWSPRSCTRPRVGRRHGGDAGRLAAAHGASGSGRCGRSWRNGPGSPASSTARIGWRGCEALAEAQGLPVDSLPLLAALLGLDPDSSGYEAEESDARRLSERIHDAAFAMVESCLDDGARSSWSRTSTGSTTTRGTWSAG